MASAHLPPVGALANIAGITSPVPFLETTLDLWNKVMAVNATGTYLVTKAFLPDMIDNGWGRIVNMSSVSAQRGGGVFGKVPYSSAKAAILGFTKALAREIADTGVTVNAVTPGAVDTNIRVGSTDEQEAKLARDIPIGRTATTDEDRRRHHVPVQRRRQLPDRHHRRHQRRQPHSLTGRDDDKVVQRSGHLHRGHARRIPRREPRYVVGVQGGVVRATTTPPGKVAVVVGGGSGHYPAFCGVVGRASPTAR